MLMWCCFLNGTRFPGRVCGALLIGLRISLVFVDLFGKGFVVVRWLVSNRVTNWVINPRECMASNSAFFLLDQNLFYKFE